jgi:hypothetical protein
MRDFYLQPNNFKQKAKPASFLLSLTQRLTWPLIFAAALQKMEKVP